MKLKIMIINYFNGIQRVVELSDTSKTKTFYITLVFSIWFNLALR
jgi:hypothetical protein